MHLCMVEVLHVGSLAPEQGVTVSNLAIRPAGERDSNTLSRAQHNTFLPEPGVLVHT